MIEAGAERLGTSSGIKIIEEYQREGREMTKMRDLLEPEFIHFDLQATTKKCCNS